jgi:hypothetical protein
MKNSGKDSRKAPGNLIRAVAAAVVVTAISVILEAGPAMAADSASTPPDTAAGQGLFARILADHALTVEILVVLAVAALVFAYGHYRRSGHRRRSAHARTGRPPAHDRASSVARMAAYSAAGDITGGPGRPAAAGDPWMPAPPSQPATSPRAAAGPPRPAAGPPRHTDDYPSWPGRPGPYALHPDHPSWPGRPDPRWAATEATLRDGYPSWPAPHSRPWRDAEPPSDDGEPGWPGGGRPAARREPPPAARRVPHGPPAVVPPPVLLAPVRAGVAPPVVITSGPGPVRHESPAGVIDRVRPEAHWVEPQRVQVWDAGAAELATWIISEANQQAADIRHEARDQVAASLADAKQEAAELVRKASEQATATLTAAEQDAAEIRATVAKLSADLGGVAAQVTQNLVGFATPATKPLTGPAVQPIARPMPEPVTEPQAWPAARSAAKPGIRPASRPTGKPGTGPAAKPGTRPAARPGTRPAARPGTRPAAKPGTRSAGRAKGTPRQLKAIRVAAAAAAALFLFAVGTGATEVALHGFSFFVFRESGAGETGPSVGTDQQFLQQQAAAAKAAAQKAHTPGRQSAKRASG